MGEDQFYHDGMRALQDLCDGRRIADAIESHHVHSFLLPEDRKIIANSTQFFIATAWEGFVDCSVKAGPAGFVRIIGEDIIEYPEYNGNSMYRTLGNLRKNGNCGLLFIQTAEPKKKLRIRGKATVTAADKSRHMDRGTKFLVQIQCQFFPNCNRYLQDGPVERGGQPPSWKMLPHLREILPADDPYGSSGRDSNGNE